MPITEDGVKNAVATWLKQRGFKSVKVRFGTSRGADVEGVSPRSGRRLVVECKGESDAPNQWDRAWRNAAYALFNAIKRTEDGGNTEDDVAIGLPDTENHRRRMNPLQAFCRRQRIAVYWVSEQGLVREVAYLGRRELDPNSLARDEDWEGNNAAFTCPKCGKIFLVSGQLHKDGRECPGCRGSKGYVVGGKQSGGTAYVEWK